MSGPEILIDINKIRTNTRKICDFCRQRGISVCGVTKVTCGMPQVGRAMLEGGAVSLGESRIENIRRLRASGINAPIIMLRIPPLSQVDEIVSNADISLNSELSVIRSLSEAAIRRGKIHKILLMVDLGDLREGIWPTDLMEICREVIELNGVRIAGIGTNLTCFGGVLPSRKNMNELVGYAEQIEKTFHIKLDIISGGNSSSLPLLLEGGMPGRINHLRIGEAIALGRETVRGRIWQGCSDDAFQLSAELIELKTKPSVPIGETGMDAFGVKPVFSDKGNIVRAILNVGREDVIVDNLIPRDKNAIILGASSDHLLLDVTAVSPPPELGDSILFNMNYGALLAAMTSNYVKKTHITGVKSIMDNPEIVMIGGSPLSDDPSLLNHIKELGYTYTVKDLPVTPENISGIGKNNQIIFVGGELNKTYDTLKGMAQVYNQLGLIIFSPSPSLFTVENSENPENYLAKTFGYFKNIDGLNFCISPENTVLVGLREAEKEEILKIRETGILAYTMEDVDLMGMREIMINALRKAGNGTDGFVVRISTDVVNAEGEGLTFREAHLAMEMIADSSQMKGLDISGTPDRSWMNDKALSSIVESAFGKRILRL